MAASSVSIRPNTSLSSDLLRSSGEYVPENVLSVALEMYDSVLTTDFVSKLDLQVSVFRIGVGTFRILNVLILA